MKNAQTNKSLNSSKSFQAHISAKDFCTSQAQRAYWYQKESAIIQKKPSSSKQWNKILKLLYNNRRRKKFYLNIFIFSTYIYAYCYYLLTKEL